MHLYKSYLEYENVRKQTWTSQSKVIKSVYLFTTKSTTQKTHLN